MKAPSALLALVMLAASACCVSAEPQRRQSTAGTLVTPSRGQAVAALPNADQQPIGYTGYIKDSESGLYYANARYYDPAVGRFTTEDPEAGNPLNPPSLHRYLYAYANPTVYVDRGGRCNTLAAGEAFCAELEFEHAALQIGADLHTREGVDATIAFQRGQSEGQWQGVKHAAGELGQFAVDLPGTVAQVLGMNVHSLDRNVERTRSLLTVLTSPIETAKAGLKQFGDSYSAAVEAGDYSRAGQLKGQVEGGIGFGAATMAATPGLAALRAERLGALTSGVADEAAAARSLADDLAGYEHQSKVQVVVEDPSGMAGARLEASHDLVNSGPVRLRPPPGATAEEIAQVQRYCQGCNDALASGDLSPTGRVSTKGALRREASRAADRERARAAAEGTPYQGHAGHVPDTTWTGKAEPPAWSDLSPRVNTSLGGQAGQFPIGYKPTIFELIQDLEPAP